MGRWKVQASGHGPAVWRRLLRPRATWGPRNAERPDGPKRAWRSPYAAAMAIGLMVLVVGAAYQITRLELFRSSGQELEFARDDLWDDELNGAAAPEQPAEETASAMQEGAVREQAGTTAFAQAAKPQGTEGETAKPNAGSGDAAGAAPAAARTAGSSATSPKPAGAGTGQNAEKASPFIRPLQPPLLGVPGSGFGWVYSETMGDWRWHSGIDLQAQKGTDVTAAAAGRVVIARQSKEWGWEVVVDHGSGLSTRYANCQAVAVSAGDTVRTGQKLAEVGEPGLAEAADGSHLHFEVLSGGRAVDPRGYLAK